MAVAALRLPAELWTLILEDVVGWSARTIDVPALEEGRARNARLLPLTAVCKDLRPLAQELLFRELATGARRSKRWTRSDLQLAALLGTLQDLTARGSPLPGRVRCLCVVVGVGGTDTAQRFQGCADMAVVAQLVALCPALRFLDVLLADPHPHGTALAFPPDALPALRDVPLRQLLVRIDDQLPRAWTLPSPAALFDFVLQALAHWPALHTLLLRLPAGGAEAALADPPPFPALKELRVAGVPPPPLLAAAVNLQTLVLVDPALAEHAPDTVFREPLAVPPSTRELVFVADCAAYGALDLSAALGLRVLSVEWAECTEDDALDRLVRVLDEAELPPGGALRLHTLRLPLAMCVFADLAGGGALSSALVALRRTLGELRRVVLGELAGAGLLERLGSSEDEMRATVRAVFEGADVDFTRERFVDPEWKALPRVN